MILLSRSPRPVAHIFSAPDMEPVRTRDAQEIALLSSATRPDGSPLYYCRPAPATCAEEIAHHLTTALWLAWTCARLRVVQAWQGKEKTR